MDSEYVTMIAYVCVCVCVCVCARARARACIKVNSKVYLLAVLKVQ
jgi:hypothetical protein